HPAQQHEDGIEFVRGNDIVGEYIIDIAVGEVSLFVGELDQLLDFLVPFLSLQFGLFPHLWFVNEFDAFFRGHRLTKYLNACVMAHQKAAQYGPFWPSSQALAAADCTVFRWSDQVGTWFA